MKTTAQDRARIRAFVRAYPDVTVCGIALPNMIDVLDDSDEAEAAHEHDAGAIETLTRAGLSATKALQEAEAAVTKALATADGHREYGDRMEEERDLARRAGEAIVGAHKIAADERDATRATCDQLSEALERTQADLADATARADGMERAGAEQARRADQNQADLAAAQEMVGELVNALHDALDDGPTSNVSDADIMQARAVLARAGALAKAQKVKP